MNLITYALVLIAALTSKTGSFNFTAKGIKYTATVVAVNASTVAPLGKFSLATASLIASEIASGNLNVTFRVGADDYTLSILAA